MDLITSGLCWSLWTTLQHDGPNHLGFVLHSVLEFFLPEGGAGTSVFRALRILRVFKLSQSMENFRR